MDTLENNKTVVAEYNDLDSNNIDSNNLFSFDEYQVLLTFFGNKNNLLKYLKNNEKIIQVTVYPSNSSDLLTSPDPSFGHFVIPVIRDGNRGGSSNTKKLKSKKTIKTHRTSRNKKQRAY